MSDPLSQLENDEIELATPANGTCGDVGNLGGGLGNISDRSSNQSTMNCDCAAEYQVFENTNPPEATMIVLACTEHIEQAAEYIEANQ
jgi:hypothetical protein